MALSTFDCHRCMFATALGDSWSMELADSFGGTARWLYGLRGVLGRFAPAAFGTTEYCERCHHAQLGPFDGLPHRRRRIGHPCPTKGAVAVKITVIGASGLIGTKVVELLTAEGHLAVPASRDSGVDVLTGEGLGDALA